MTLRAITAHKAVTPTTAAPMRASRVLSTRESLMVSSLIFEIASRRSLPFHCSHSRPEHHRRHSRRRRGRISVHSVGISRVSQAKLSESVKKSSLDRALLRLILNISILTNKVEVKAAVSNFYEALNDLFEDDVTPMKSA